MTQNEIATELELVLEDLELLQFNIEKIVKEIKDNV